MAVYQAESDNFSHAVAQLMLTFKKENPTLTGCSVTLRDGSTAKFNFKDSNPGRPPKGVKSRTGGQTTEVSAAREDRPRSRPKKEVGDG